MAFPTVVATADWNTTAGGPTTAHKAATPAGVQAGDLLIVTWGRIGANGVGTLDGKWTLLQSTTGNTMGAMCAYAVASGSESGDLAFTTITSDHGTSTTYLIRNYSGTPEAAAYALVTASTAPNPPSLNPAGWGTEDTLWIASAFRNGNVTSDTAPTNYTNHIDNKVTAVNVGIATARRNLNAASEDPGTFTLSGACAHHSTTIAILGFIDKTGSDTGSGSDAVPTFEMMQTDAGAGADTLTDREFTFDDTGAGVETIATFETSYSDTGSGVDDGGLELTAVDADFGVGTDAVLSIETSLSTGKIHIGKFVEATPIYTLENEIVSHDSVDEGRHRINVVVVDGQEHSWTEYDRSDLVARDAAVNMYLDLPELKTAGQVRSRAAEELQTARAVISPGGEIVGPMVLVTTRMDPIFWIDEDGNKYQTRIEGKHVTFNQSSEPEQRAVIDTGAIIFCPPDEGDVTYIARDLFDRETPVGLDDALIGGTWTVYT